MATKPFSLQSPEQIAKDYGGNKQKIAEAMQMGILHPTPGTLAGMFIDRMRSAQAQEAAPQQTVAQQVFSPQPPQGAPPSPVGGLGATPQAAPPMAPDMSAMGAPEGEPMGMKGGGRVRGHVEHRSEAGRGYTSYGATVPIDERTRFNLEAGGRRPFDPDSIRAAIQHMFGDASISVDHALRGSGTDYGVDVPFLGGDLGIHAGASRGFVPDSISASYRRQFAAGGMVPPYAMGGGLSDMPIPDTMFDEPSNGGFDDGYAGGGIVAFAQGGDTNRPIGPWLESQAIEAIPGIGITSRQRSAAHNAQVGGNPHSYHLTNNARDFVPPKGMGMDTLYASLKHLYGSGYDVVNERDHIHVEPGSRRAAPKKTPVRAQATASPPAASAAPTEAIASAPSPAAAPDMSAVQDQLNALAKLRADDLADAKRDRRQAAWASIGQQGLAMLQPQGIPEGMFASGGVVHYAAGAQGSVQPPVKDPMDAFSPANLQASQASLSALMPQTNKYADLGVQDVERRRSPEYIASERKQIANQALMNFGLALMASKNPNFLGGIGEAGMPAVQQMGAEFKDLKKEARDALVEGAQYENMKNTAAQKLADLMLSHANTVATLKAGNLDRQSRERMEELQRSTQMQIAKLQQNGENYRTRLQVQGDLAKGPGSMSTSQLTDLSGQFKSRAEDALKAMAAAESNGDYAQFQAAATNYKQALTGYNDIVKRLGLPGMGSVTMGKFPTMAQEMKRRRGQEAPKAASSVMSQADAILAGNR